MSAEVTRYLGESYVAFLNRQLRAKGRDDIEWIQTSDGRTVLRDVERKQGKLDV